MVTLKPFHERYLDRRGYFSDTRSSLARRRLDACAKDLWELIDRFRGHKKVCHLKQYRHLQRLFKDQCELQTSTEDTSSDRLALPKDPESVASASLPVSEEKAHDEEAETGVCPTLHPPSPPQPTPSSQEADTPETDIPLIDETPSVGSETLVPNRAVHSSQDADVPAAGSWLEGTLTILE